MRKPVWRAACSGVALALLISAGTARAGGPAEALDHKKWHPWFELGGYLSNERSRGEAALWAPLWQSQTALMFTEIRGKLFDEDAQEGNFALGMRVMLPSGWNLGAWGGWDHRRTALDNSFNQVSFGVEALSERFDLRANGYVPIDDRAHVSNSTTFTPGSPFAQLTGNQLSVVTGGNTTTTTELFELAHHGFDAEVGVLLFGGAGRSGGGLKEVSTSSRRHELRVYGGGFWFDNDDATQEIAGPRGRIEFRINDIIQSLPGSRLTIEGEVSHDDVRDDRWEIGARLRIPFVGGRRHGGSSYASLTAQEQRMMEALERDTDVVAQSQSETTQIVTPLVQEGAIDDATNVALNQVAFANSNTGLQTAVATGANTLIIVQGSGGQIDVSVTDGQALQASQTIQGGGSTIHIRGATTGTVVPFTAPGAQPTLFSNNVSSFNTGIVTVASNTHVAGLNILGPGGGVGGQNTGIVGNSVNNVVIEQSVISNIGNGMRFLGGSDNITVSNNTVLNSSFQGIQITSGSTNVTVSGNAISNTGTDGVSVISNNSNVTVSGNTISGTGSGVLLFDGNSDVRILNNVISNVGPGVFFRDNNSNVTVSGNTISNTTGDGVFFDDNNTNLTLSNNTFTAIGNGSASDDVFDFDGAGNTLLPGSTGNVVTTAPNAGVICRGAGNFTGTLQVTDQNGVLQTFVDSAGCN